MHIIIIQFFVLLVCLSHSIILSSSIFCAEYFNRAGWELRSLHTFFQYIHRSGTLEKERGLAAANWMIKQGGDRIDGLSPHLMDATVGLSDSEASVHSQLIDDFRSKLYLFKFADGVGEAKYFPCCLSLLMGGIQRFD